jgi:N-acetyl sugar amidotransferase
MSSQMARMICCSRCGLPETYETIEFDDKGVCNICRSAEYKEEIDWSERKILLDELIEKHRGKYDYDCIIPFSGGKDSTYQLYYLMKEYKIKPLLIRFNHLFMRPTVQENVDLITRKLGVDVLEFRPNWHIVKRLMKESFLRKTDFCWHCHTGIYSYPLRMAVKLNIPLIFWGEPLAELSAYYDYLNDDLEYEDEKKFNMFRNLGISAADMKGMISDTENPIDERDLLPFTYPSLKELKALKYISVCLGSFIPWDYQKNSAVIKKELGWKADKVEGVAENINDHGEKIECFMQGSRDYIKYLKRGYSRATQINAIKIRQGKLSLEEALLLNQADGQRPPSLDILLEYLDIPESEFNQHVYSQAIYPFSPDFNQVRHADQTWDLIHCYRENSAANIAEIGNEKKECVEEIKPLDSKPENTTSDDELGLGSDLLPIK